MQDNQITCECKKIGCAICTPVLGVNVSDGVKVIGKMV